MAIANTIRMGSTELYMSDSNGTYPMSYGMSISTGTFVTCASTNWHPSDSYVPKPIKRECEWCNSLFNSSVFYPGNCICCGGPRGC